MKKVLLILSVVLGCYLNSNAQGQYKVFLDRLDKPTDSASASSYIVVTEKGPQDSVWRLKQFSKSSQLLYSTSFKDSDLTVTHGPTKVYQFRSANTKGSANNTQPDGTAETFLIDSGNYVDGNREGIWTRFTENGDILHTESFLRNVQHGRATYYSSTGSILTEGEYVNGKREGKWYGAKLVLEYKGGILISTTPAGQRKPEQDDAGKKKKRN